MDDMAEAIMRQASHRAASMRVDRRGWTKAQWAEDARRLMHDVDGAVTSLVNGHVTGLLDELDAARARIAELEGELAAAESTIAALEDPELRAALTTPTSGDYGPVPDPRKD